MESIIVKTFNIKVSTGNEEKTYSRIQYAEEENAIKYSEQLMNYMSKHVCMRFVDVISKKNIILNLGKLLYIEVEESTVDIIHTNKALYERLISEGFRINENQQFENESRE